MKLIFVLLNFSVLERPTSQMSYLEHFLKETASGTRHGSVGSVEGDIEDNRAPSITSSKSNLSELSIVSRQNENHKLAIVIFGLNVFGLKL